MAAMNDLGYTVEVKNTLPDPPHTCRTPSYWGVVDQTRYVEYDVVKCNECGRRWTYRYKYSSSWSLSWIPLTILHLEYWKLMFKKKEKK